MATKLKIEKRGDEIIPLEMYFFVDLLLLQLGALTKNYVH
jgi:hypothetical protein